MNIFLWIAQFFLGALFIFAGVMKFIMPVDDMNTDSPLPLPGAILHFIGACEILGGLGLILPWLLGVKRGLTPLAAGLLTIIMIGATAVTAIGSPLQAIFPATVGAVLVLIAWQRSRGI
jgi:uncharacterized membrane protein YphA (DoxX/SURF4 family)